MREIRFGIIGCGLMGREFASAIARWCHLLDVDFKPSLVGICDTNPALFGWYRQHFPTIKIATADYGDLLVHVFSPKAREYYDLERLWRSAKTVEIPPE